MRSLLDTEEIEDKASEITLSTASLLGIFFGLVLICGVFFGFGYSMGRGTGHGAQASGLGTAPTSDSAESGETTTAANQPPAALAQAEQHDELPAPAKAAPASSVARSKPLDSALADTDADDARPAQRPAGNKPAAAQKAVATLPTASAPNSGAASVSGQPMVQIAAVSRLEDADVLVSALRQRGYGVVVRNEPQDKLLHVQVGPFADRVQALAIKQKLLSDGYNAIIKQ